MMLAELAFTAQWLDLRKICDTSPDRDLLPEYFPDNLAVDSATYGVPGALGV